MILQDPNRKHGEPLFKGPYTVTQVYNNGTVQLTKAADNGGAVSQTWNIRNFETSNPLQLDPLQPKYQRSLCFNSKSHECNILYILYTMFITFQAFTHTLPLHYNPCHGGECNTLKSPRA